MRRLALVLLQACTAAVPALAQETHGDHAGSSATPPADDQAPDHEVMDHGTMDHGTMDQGMEGAASPEPPVEVPQDHSQHAGHAPEPAGDDAPGNAPAPPVPADRAADAYFPREKMDQSFKDSLEEMDFRTFALQIDEIEYRARSGEDGYGFEGEAWYGGDIDRVVLGFEGEGGFGGKAEEVEIDGYWRHALDPWFNLQVGVRHDFRPDPDRTYAMVGIQGLAPYWFEVQGRMFVSTKGDVHARAMASYDQRITQRLILEPEAELDFAFQDVPELGIGSGFEKIELAARLRYEITPMVAPYLGVLWERRLGGTADYARAAGEKPATSSVVAGLRVWF